MGGDWREMPADGDVSGSVYIAELLGSGGGGMVSFFGTAGGG